MHHHSTLIKSLRLLLLATFLFTFALMPFAAQPARAAGITVNTNTDELNADGDCSLREAIQSANTDTSVDACTSGSGADVIDFAAVMTVTIGIAGVGEDANATGDYDIASPITIQNTSGGTVTIAGGGLDRIFDVVSGSLAVDGSTNPITISGGTTAAAGEFGGGIYVGTGASLSLDGVTLSGNTTATPGGGAIYNQGTITSITNSTFSGNTSTAFFGVGGGIMNGYYDFGGPASFPGTITIISNTIFSNNSASGAFGNGGAIYNFVGSIGTITNVQFDSNTADPAGAGGQGGAIYNSGEFGANPPNTIGTITQSTFTGSDADVAGGAIMMAGGSITTIDHSTFSANTVISGAAVGWGAAIFVEAGATIININHVTFVDNQGDHATGGTSIHNRGTITSFTYSYVVDNIGAGANCGGITSATAYDDDNTCDSSVGNVNNAANTDYSALTNNGCVTALPGGVCVTTHALLPAGNLDDAGINCADTDQIGTTRDTTCDIGSFELFIAQPDLTVAKSSDDSSEVVGSAAWNWTLAISNGGAGTATFPAASTVLTDTFPAGPGYTDPGTVNLSTGTMSCTFAGNLLTCTTAAGGTITNGATINVVVPTTATSPETFTNTAANCTVDGGTAVAESNEGNNNCTADDAVSVAGADLTVAKTSDDSSEVVSSAAWNWTLAINNGGAATAFISSGATVLTDTFPSGPIYTDPGTVNLSTGTMVCTFAGNLLTCTSVTGGTIINGVTINVVVPTTSSVPGTFTNTAANCTVDPGTSIAEDNEGNNNCAADDAVTVAAPDLTVAKTSNDSNEVVGSAAWNWTLAISNGGTATATFPAGSTVLTDTFPLEPGYTDPGTVNLSTGSMDCTFTSAILTCTTAAGGTITNGATINVVVPTTSSVPGIFTNTAANCTVDSGTVVTETNEGNNNCTADDAVTVAGPDFNISKTSNDSNEDLDTGAAWTWTITMNNIGEAVSFETNEVIFSDQLDTDAGLNYGAMISSSTNLTGGADIFCSISAGDLLTCTANGTVTFGASTGQLVLQIPVTATNAGTFSNAGATCKADPGNVIVENSESNNTCTTDNVTVTAPELQASKVNDVSGSITMGNNWTWTTTITNTGTSDATFQDGELIFVDDLPNTNITYSGFSTLNLINITGTGPISCAESGYKITCYATGGAVTIGAATGSFDVAITGTPSAAGTFDNPRAGQTCAVDSTFKVTESNETNNTCSDTVTVVQPDLTISKASDDNNENLDAGAAWNWDVTVSNIGGADAAFTAGQTILSDQLDTDAGVSYGTPTVNSWVNVTNDAEITCSISAGDLLTCWVDTATVTIGDTTGTFTVTIPVTATATGTYTNTGSTCQVDPDGNITESSESNNTCTTDSVTVGAPDMQMSKANDTSNTVVVNGSFNWTATLSNEGNRQAAFSNGEVFFTDVLPSAGVAYGTVTTIFGSAVDCLISVNTLTCTTNIPISLGPGGSFDVVIPVTATAVGTLTNTAATCVVDPNDLIEEGTNEGNNTCGTDNVVTVTGADLTASKTNDTSSNVVENGAFNWTITVAGGGVTSADFTDGQVILEDNLPAGATYGTPTDGNIVGTVTGTIDCSITTNVLTCVANGAVSIGTTGSFDVTIPVTDAGLAGSLVNPSTTCTADPDDVIGETSEVNNDCADTVNVYANSGIHITVQGTGNGKGGMYNLTTHDVVNCGYTGTNTNGDCDYAVRAGRTVKIKANVRAGSKFVGWTGCDSTYLDGAGNTICVLIPYGPHTITAEFELLAPEEYLTLTKTVSGSSYDIGEAFSYTIVLTNTGSAAVNTITITDAVPTGINITNVTATNGGVAGFTGQDVTVTYASLEAKQSSTITIDVVGDAGATPGTFCNAARVVAGSLDFTTPDACFALNGLTPATLTVDGAGTGNGRVNSMNPHAGEITCDTDAGVTSNDCTYTDIPVQNVSLRAVEDAGSDFVSWAGCDSTSGTNNEICAIAVGTNVTVTATFDLEPVIPPPSGKVTITVAGAGAGRGTMFTVTNPTDAIDCLSTAGVLTGPSCDFTKLPPKLVKIKAKAKNGSTFVSWTGCDSTSGANNEICWVDMATNVTVTAEFALAAPAVRYMTDSGVSKSALGSQRLPFKMERV